MLNKLDIHALLCRFRRRIQHPGRAALILPPARPGSMGDHAMMQTTLSILRQTGFDRIGILTYAKEDAYTAAPDIEHHQLNDYLRIGRKEGLMRFILYAQGYTHFYLIGADVMDGYYSAQETLKKIELARLAARCGLNTTLLGFSFNAHADKDCTEALRALPAAVTMHARDPVSHRRLSELLGRDIACSADLAFLLAPNSSRPEVRAFIDRLNKLKADGRILLGINLAHHVMGTNPSQEQLTTLLDRAREAILSTAAKQPNATFIFFSHDVRGPMSDMILSRQLMESLSKGLAESRMLLMPDAIGSDEIKAICAPLDAAFTCRMHFGIACLSQGIPIAAIGYQGKFEGMMERFGLESMLFPDANALECNSLTPLIEKLIVERNRLKAGVLEKLPDIMRLAACNFSGSLSGQTIAKLVKRSGRAEIFRGVLPQARN